MPEGEEMQQLRGKTPGDRPNSCGSVSPVVLTPIQRPQEDVAFLERVAVSVERAKVIAPDTRDYLSELASRHQSRLRDGKLDARRQKALERITAAASAARRP